MELTVSDFEYSLPDELIAQEPARRRDRSRLMLLDRADGRVSHHIFADLANLLQGGDLLVLNDTRVIPGRFSCRRKTSGVIEGLFLKEIGIGRWQVMLKKAGRCQAGETLALAGPGERAMQLCENLGGGNYMVEVSPAGRAVEILRTAGKTPLPPYIRRPDASEEPHDRLRYQTIYAARDGAIAAPTAGLHFTEEIFDKLKWRGVTTCRLTLHVGAGTFLPVKVSDIAKHKMHSEAYEISAHTAEALNSAESAGRRIVAVGTTTVRALESAIRQSDSGKFVPTSAVTDIFIYPPAEFRVAGAMITNFHLPASTLLMLVSAFCGENCTDGIQMILNAYARAIEEKYRFYSYGDAMLIR